jgi:uncharacterized membrane protein YcaP (DUF421 family)
MDIVLRAIAIFVLINVLMRALGRRELSKMEPFDLIILVVIADLVQQGVTQQDYSVTGAMLAVGTIGVLVVASSALSFYFPWVRPVLNGRPVVLVEDGKPIEDNMRRERITPDELVAQARLQGLASLDPVRWAVLETGGQISFVRKEER